MAEEKKNNNNLLVTIICGIVVLIGIISVVVLLTSGRSGGNAGGSSDNGGSSVQVEGEGKFKYYGLSFDLPSEYEDKGDGNYEFRDDDNAIMIQVYKKDNYSDSVNRYIERDENMFYPIKDGISEVVFNGNLWYKGKGKDGDYLYYVKKGNTVYMVAISPIFAKTTRVNELISTFEKNLFVK